MRFEVNLAVEGKPEEMTQFVQKFVNNLINKGKNVLATPNPTAETMIADIMKAAQNVPGINMVPGTKFPKDGKNYQFEGPSDIKTQTQHPAVVPEKDPKEKKSG